jgi:hypothetical protein
LELRAFDNETCKITSIVIEQGDFVISFTVLENIHAQRTDFGVGSGQTTRTRNSDRVWTKCEYSFTAGEILEDDVGIQETWSAFNRAI